MELHEALAGCSDLAIGLYRTIEAELVESPAVRVHPQKTRIAFISRMTFASVTLARRWVDVTLILPRAVDNQRIRRIELYGPTSFAHLLRLHHPDEIDGVVGQWLAEAARRGAQETLDPTASVEPAVGRALEVLVVPLRAKVAGIGTEAVVRIPRHAGEIFGDHQIVDVRLAGQHARGRIEATADGPVVVLDGRQLRELGLGDGEPVDVQLAAG